MQIRLATPADWPAIFLFFATIVADGQTYAYPDGLTSDEARPLWMDGRVTVAEEDGTIVGSARMAPNRPGRGAHIATASFMVNPEIQGKGVGRALGEEMIAWARREGYRGIQFNAVVETNHGAVKLWQSLGFEIIGTIPGAFHHRTHGYVGLNVMFLAL